MTARAKLRFATGAAAVAGAATLAALVGGHNGSRGRFAAGVIEPLSVVVTAKAGGVVREALARPGERISAGQALLRFDAAAMEAQRTDLRAALESAKGIASLPRAAGDVAVDAHPEVIAAEEAYVRALEQFDRAPAQARAALDRAAAARTETRMRIGRRLSKSAAGMSSTAATIEARLRDLDRTLEEREVRAATAGVVEILDLRAGDRVPPGGPIAVLTVPGEYVCEFTAPRADGLAAGAAVRVMLGGRTVEGRVERLETRRIPVALREDRRVAEEIVARVRVASETPIAAGAPAKVELP